VDHLAALAPIAVEDPRKAGRVGAYWGMGHGVGVLIVGLLGLLLRGLIDIDAWSSWAEFLVGFLLLGVGLWAIWRSRSIAIHSHPHEHSDSEHLHLHAHRTGSHKHEHAALGVGTLHGLAGSGHLFGVLPALALPTGLAVAYLVAYLIAAIASMSAFAYGLGHLAKRSGTVWVRRLMLGSGAIALVVGAVWIVNANPF